MGRAIAPQLTILDCSSSRLTNYFVNPELGPGITAEPLPFEPNLPIPSHRSNSDLERPRTGLSISTDSDRPTPRAQTRWPQLHPGAAKPSVLAPNPKRCPLNQQGRHRHNRKGKPSPNQSFYVTLCALSSAHGAQTCKPAEHLSNYQLVSHKLPHL